MKSGVRFEPYTHAWAKDEVQNILSHYIQSIDQTIQCCHELETYLVNEQCPVHRLALAKRRVFLLKAEREWAMSFLEEYKEENPSSYFSWHAPAPDTLGNPPRISPCTSKGTNPPPRVFHLVS